MSTKEEAMLNTLLNYIQLLLTNFTISLRLVLSIAFIILISIIIYQSNVITTSKENIAVLEYQLVNVQTMYTEEVSKAKDIIKKQNLSINQITMDKEYYENKVKLKEQELKEYTKVKKSSIMSNLLNDSSTENQLELITKILGDFSNESN